MPESPEQIGQWLDQIFSYGVFWVYAALFVACFIENIIPPFPGDSFIAAAGALVASGRLTLATSFMVVLAGGMLSVMVMYVLGRRFGRGYFMEKDYKYFSAEDILKFEKNLNRWGPLLMIGSRFVVGFRAAIAVGAGIARYPAWWMVLYSLISYVLFTGLIFFLAMVVVDNLQLIGQYFRTYNMIAWPVVLGAVAAVIIWKVRRVRKKRRGKARV